MMMSVMPFLLFSLLLSFSSNSLGQEMTALQKHVSFFDRNKDGVIYPTETFQGFRAIGVGAAEASASAALIHAALSPKTSNSTLPNPLLPIYVSNIAKGKHGSDTGVYDTEGRFVPEKFEEIFQKHAHTDPNSLTKDEVDEMLKANQQPGDTAGSNAAKGEFNLLYDLGKDKNGVLQKDTVRSVYDGSLFYQLEKQHSSSSK